MIKDQKKIWSIFTPPERRQAVWILLLVILMAMAETLGVPSIKPFLPVLGRPAVIRENSCLRAIYERLGFRFTEGFILALGLCSTTLVIASPTGHKAAR